MQYIPVDVGRLGALMVVVAPEPRVNQETGEIRRNKIGMPLWVVGVSVRQRESRRADVIEIVVPGEITGLAEGMRVHANDLVATNWEIDGRSGTSFRASNVVPAVAAPVAAEAPPSGGSSSARTKGGDQR